MSFWDNVKKFAQPYADEEYDDYDDEEMEGYADEEPRGRRAPAYAQPPMEQPQQPAADFGAPAYTAPAYSAPAAPAAAPAYTAPAYTAPVAEQRPSGFNGTVLNMNANKQEVVLYHAKAFDDAAKAADELRNRRAVILNMENVDKALTRRVVDFLSGCVYALDGQVKKIAQSTYLFCPHSMDIVGDLESFQAQAESYI